MEARLLALDLAVVAREEAGPLERRAQVLVGLAQGAGDAVTHGAGLAADAAAEHVDADVELAAGAGGLERHERDRLQDLATEVRVDLATVDDDLAGAGAQGDAGDAGLALAGRAIGHCVNHAAYSLISSVSGICASWGCSAPA